MAFEITAIVKSGMRAGTKLTPHRYKEGHYLVTKGGNTKDFCIKIYSYDLLVRYIGTGYGVRMSGEGVPASIYGPVSLNIKVK